jgi:hypothetical protein
MRNHQVRFGMDSQFDSGQGRIDARRDAPDAARVFHLQSVTGSVPVAKSVGTQQLLAAADEVGQFRFRHGRMRAKKTGAGNAGKKIFATPY